MNRSDRSLLVFILAMLLTGISWGGEVPPPPGTVGYVLASIFVAVVIVVIALLVVDLVRAALRRGP